MFINFFKSKKTALMATLFVALFVSFFSFAIFGQAKEYECKDYSSEDAFGTDEYDKIIAACDAEILVEREKLAEKKTETSGIKTEIRRLDQKIKISQSYINKKIAKANRLKQDIKTNESDVDNLETDLEKITTSLSTLLFKTNILETNTTVEALLVSDSLSDYFSGTQLTRIFGDQIAEKIETIKDEKDSLERLMVELSEREMLERQLAIEKKSEKDKVKKNQRYKNELLGILKQEEGDLQKVITDKEKVRQTILQRKFTLASGDKVTFGEAYNIIKPFKGALGLDPAFVLAILFQESGYKGKIGGNIGRCYYNQKNSHGYTKNGYEAMSKSQQTNFVKIMNGLSIDPSKQAISCPIPRDGSYGGAMGPAQFMPNTWMSIRDRAGAILGKKGSDMSPFINGDAFIASASYLKDQYYSTSCSSYANKYKHISSERTLRERCAASRYYAGGNWWKYRMRYGQSVVNRANRFRDDIRTIEED